MRRALLLVLVASCSAETTPLCPEMSINVDGLCRPRCVTSLECLIGETCSGGACVPGEPPPPPPRDGGFEPRDSGMRCNRDVDCGERMMTEWSRCEGFESVCDEDGERQRDVGIPRCKDGVCDLFFDVEKESCTVSKSGMECEPRMPGEWGECTFDDECVTGGKRRRNVATFECSTGACVQKDSEEQERCARPSTEGSSCAPYADTVSGPCVAADCADAPTMDVMERAYTCVNERCEPHVTGGEAMICGASPAPDGTSCGNDMQCCNRSCTALDDPEHCGVCGVSCSNSRGCVPLPLVGGPTYYACECENELECLAYGVNGGCVMGPGGAGLCSCGCVGGAMTCSGPCASGSCHVSMTQPFGWCAYP